ncbi:MAG: RagB/SusD family nutrient uptake outer membrane protein [Rikenellaceae bacterium]
MKNILKIKAILTFVVLMTFSSCDEFLNRAPLDEISTETYWTKASELDAYIVGKYNWLPGQLSDWSMGYFIDDVVSDDMINGITHNSWMNGETLTAPASGGSWVWTTIRAINYFFDNCGKCEDSFESWKHTYGEACFLKAMEYHDLVKLFGDVPWYTHVISSSDTEALNAPRDPRNVVVDSIMNLIDQSVEFLDTRAEAGVNRLNKETALIYKSRVALYEATWAKYHAGTDFASTVDANKYFQIAIDVFEEFKQEFGDPSAYLYTTGDTSSDYYNLFNQFDYSAINEVTLAKSYSEALSVKNNTNIEVWLYGYANCSYSLNLIRSYLGKDGNYIDIMDENVITSSGGVTYLTELAGKLDPRFSQSVFIPGDLINTTTPPYADSLFTIVQLNHSDATRNTTSGFAPKKGHNPDGTMTNQTDPLVDGIAFRVAELMLNYAEAYVELKGTYPDLSDNVDALRARVGMPTLTDVKPEVNANWPDYGYTVSDQLAIIRQERRVELAGEGYRKDDWKRWRAHMLFEGTRPKGGRYEAADYENQLVQPSIPVDSDGYLDPLYTSLEYLGGAYDFREDRDYFYPIPTDELIINENLVQNPGWDD